MAKPESTEYMEVWGDTVRGKHLAIGVCVGIVFALIGLLGGRFVLDSMGVSPVMAKTWSLVTGLVGCILCGVVVAILFKPARTVTADSSDAQRIKDTVAELAANPQGLGTLDQVTQKSREELAQSGLDVWFTDRNDGKGTNHAVGPHSTVAGEGSK